MFKKIKNLFNKPVVVDDWYADFKMEDGQTGRVFSVWELEAVEGVARKRGHKSLMWSVKGDEWFDSFKYQGN